MIKRYWTVLPRQSFLHFWDQNTSLQKQLEMGLMRYAKRGLQKLISLANQALHQS
jgi:hypothetical protein